MCNDYGSRVTLEQLEQILCDQGLHLGARGSNLRPRDDIRPSDLAPVLRKQQDDGSIALAELKWGFPPPRPKASPVINFRSEGREFTHGRCLLPASHFFEFTGTTSPKQKWKFSRIDDDWFGIAGLWRQAPDGQQAVTMLTAAPGPDIAPIHDRQIVIIDRADYREWLISDNSVKHLLRPLPAGTLQVEQLPPASKQTSQTRLL